MMCNVFAAPRRTRLRESIAAICDLHMWLESGEGSRGPAPCFHFWLFGWCYVGSRPEYMEPRERVRHVAGCCDDGEDALG